MERMRKFAFKSNNNDKREEEKKIGKDKQVL